MTADINDGRSDQDDGGDVGGRRAARSTAPPRRRCSGRPQRRRAGDAVQVAVEEPAAADRRQHDRARRAARTPCSSRTSSKQIIAAGQTITEKLAPVKDPAGKPRPWDIEFGFKGGKLWLFQCRPFLGNDSLKNIPALAPLEVASGKNGGTDALPGGRDPMKRAAGASLLACSARAGRRARPSPRSRPSDTTLGRQRAAPGRLLPLVRAVLLHGLRAADPGSGAASTSSSRAATRCA